MKPVRLSIKGLNSFAQEQIIDFEALSARGLFGIFGPTGSGKSTVLDAITFALYGKIARDSGAKSNEQFININEKSARVALDFEIHADERRRYRALREIKRKEQGGVLTTQLKFYDITEEEQLLAEKGGEFQEQIKRVIGLTYDDFVKTVVLPQGGFQDFLKLENSDRREVLERLFNLEQYGEQLARKVNAQHLKKNQQRIKCEGEQLAYEGLSRAVLQERKQAIDAQQAQLEKQRAAAAEAKERVLRLRQQFDAQQTLARLTRELEQKQAQTTQMKQRAESVQRNRQYQTLEALMTEYERTVEEGKRAKQELATSEEQEKRVRTESEQVRAAYQQLEKQRSEEYPALLKRQTQLEGAVSGYQEYQRVQRSATELGERCRRLEKARAEAAQKHNALQTQQQEQEQRLEAARRELSLLTGADQRQGMSNAILLVQKAVALQEKRAALEAHAQQLEHLCKVLPTAEEQDALAQVEAQIHAVRVELERMEQELSRLGEGAGESPKELLLKLQEREAQIAAHSKRIEIEEVQKRKTETALREAQERLQNAELALVKAQTEQTHAQEQQVQLAQKLKEASGGTENPEQELAGLKQKTQMLVAEHENIQKRHQSVTEQHRTLDTALKLAQEKRARLVQQARTMQEQLYARIEELEIAQFTVESPAERMAQLQQEIARIKSWRLSREEALAYEREIGEHQSALDALSGQVAALEGQAQLPILSEVQYTAEEEAAKRMEQELEQETARGAQELAQYQADLARIVRKEALDAQLSALARELSILQELKNMLSGRKFVEYMAIHQLRYVTLEASALLGEITSGAYAIEVDESGSFKIRDNKNGGQQRNVKSLSGGETFLVSLALALALSAQIQLKGVAPLELFFLDEGFGTLDEGLLDTVMEALERVQHDRLRIGIISHVEQLKERIPVRLNVMQAESGRGGSRVQIEWN